MEGISIRRATFDDAAEIANVHINSWREAYKGLISSDFLDDRPLFFKNRFELWKRATRDLEQVTLVAECEKNGVIGFINGGAARDPAKKDYVEVWCLYLLKKYHGKRVGLNLLKSFFELQIEKGFQKGYLWVLKGNPTISFYEKTGGYYNGEAKDDEIGTQTLCELCYVWDNISL